MKRRCYRLIFPSAVLILAIAKALSADGSPGEDVQTIVAEERERLIEEDRTYFQKWRHASPEVRRQALADWDKLREAQREDWIQAADRVVELEIPREIPLIEEIALPPELPNEVVAMLVEGGELENDRIELWNSFRFASRDERSSVLADFDDAHQGAFRALSEGMRIFSTRNTPPNPIASLPAAIPATADPITKAVLEEQNALSQEHAVFEERIGRLSAQEVALERERWERTMQPRHEALRQKLEQISNR